MKKDFEASLNQMNPDVLCLQETKAQEPRSVLKPVSGCAIEGTLARVKNRSYRTIRRSVAGYSAGDPNMCLAKNPI